ncbi:TIGR03364 family FAD-dependent oxidoreductase [Niastella populi]|uniref:Oxidoreductase n=1 Tax=Niastella populi TaxID=550983 RepID=A0A1V9FE09_9BACT|nr:TIGR03364 family FAD-dependent oxidoreductase [Niastella populi]OQP56605.1 oxidoreductase [Niastella populi]
MLKPTAIVIGAGIAGLAMARALAIKGYAVTVIERGHQATGASVRNFGMVWPVGQPAGKLYERAIRSRNIWKEIGGTGAFSFEQPGSLHLAHNETEWQVLQELYEQFKAERGVSLLTPEQVVGMSPAVVPEKLKGGLYSTEEVIVDPREAIACLPSWLKEKHGVTFLWGRCVSYIAGNTVVVGKHEQYSADLVFICSGADFETLYPEVFRSMPVTRCKLQMMRFEPQPGNWHIGPALCGGLSLIHYKSFSTAPSILLLRRRYEQELPGHVRWGIHVMVSQNSRFELTVGDSHEYGLSPDPFDKASINQLILDYLKTFASFKSNTITATWNGVYAKLTNGDSHLFESPEPGVYIFNGLGGAGMTLSFGLAEEIISGL